MHFGRDATLPDIPLLAPAPKVVFNELISEHKGQVYLGLPSWADALWKGVIYPSGLKKSEYLMYYSRQFGFVEFNASFYGSFNATQYAKWAASVSSGFVFLPKVPATISHRKRLRHCHQSIEHFANSLLQGNPKIKMVFLQLQEQFTTSSWPDLKHFVETFPQSFKLLLEFRHPSWFVDGQVESSVASFLSSFGHGLVITDAQGAGYVLHCTLTAPIVLLRFQSEDASIFDEQRIDRWTDIIAQLGKSKEVQWYVSLHQPEPQKVPDLIRLWEKQLIQKSIWSREDNPYLPTIW